jgi:hypothetical protein
MAPHTHKFFFGEVHVCRHNEWAYSWKIKVPLKTRIFMWFLYRKVILEKIILRKEDVQGVQNAFSVGIRKQLMTTYLCPVLLHVLFGE